MLQLLQETLLIIFWWSAIYQEPDKIYSFMLVGLLIPHSIQLLPMDYTIFVRSIGSLPSHITRSVASVAWAVTWVRAPDVSSDWIKLQSSATWVCFKCQQFTCSRKGWECRVKCQVMLFKLIAFSVFREATVDWGWLEKAASRTWPSDEQMGKISECSNKNVTAKVRPRCSRWYTSWPTCFNSHVVLCTSYYSLDSYNLYVCREKCDDFHQIWIKGSMQMFLHSNQNYDQSKALTIMSCFHLHLHQSNHHNNYLPHDLSTRNVWHGWLQLTSDYTVTDVQ